MKRLKYILFFTAFFTTSGLIILQSCVKDKLDFKKISDMVELNPDLYFPAAKGLLTIEDLFRDEFEDSTILKRGDTLLVVFTEDNIFEFNADDFITIPDQNNSYSYRIVATEDIFYPFDTTYYLPLDLVKDSIEISLGNNMRIDSLFTNSGNLVLDIASNFTIYGALHVRVPSLYLNNEPFDSLFAFSRPIGDYHEIHNIPLENAKIVVDNSNPNFSKLKIELSVVVELHPGDMIHINDSATLNIRIQDIEDFEALFGYAGDTTFVQDTIIDTELEEIENITGTFAITNPKIRINYEHSIGVPIGFDFKIKGYFDDGDSVVLDPPVQNMVAPSDYRYPDVGGNFTFDRSNISNIDQFLVFPPPVSIGYEAEIRSNPTGETTVPNFILGDSKALLGMEVEVPLEFRADLTLRDTLDLDISDEDKENSDYIEFVRMHYRFKNEFPIGFNASLILYDSISNRNVDTIFLNDLEQQSFIEAAPVDAEGVTIADQVEEYTGATTLEANQIHNLYYEANKLILVAKIRSYDPENVGSVKILDYYQLDFRMSLESKIHYEGNFKDQ